MPAVLSDAGLAVQTLAEILAEVRADLQDPVIGFGPLHDVTSPTSPVAVLAGLHARREALIQSLLSSLTSALYPAGAAGTMLDRQATIVGADPRVVESNSTVAARLTGTAGTNVSNKLVRYIPTGTLWRTPGVAILDGGGEFIGILRAEDEGPLVADASSQWEIVSTTNGWTDVVSIEQAQLGELEEDDPTMRERLALTDSVGRATEPAIYARLYAVPGVSQVVVDNNRELFPNINGVPGKTVESLVIGGEDSVIAELLHETYSADSGSFGNTTVTFTNRYGKETTIQFSRVDDVLMYVSVTLLVSGAEVPLPPDYEAQVRQALATRSLDIVPGQDLQSSFFVGAIANALPVNSTVTISVSFSPFQSGPFFLGVPMTSRQRAIFVNGPTPATVDSLQKPGGFTITANWDLNFKIDGGPTVFVNFDGGVNLTSQSVAAEIQAAIDLAGVAATASGALNRVRIRTNSTGNTASIQILNTSTPGLLAVLGNDFSVPDIHFGSNQGIPQILTV